MWDETAKDNHLTVALISHALRRNNELAFSSMRNLQFNRFQILKLFFLNFGFHRIDTNDILQKSDLFASRAVQKVMLVGCDW